MQSHCWAGRMINDRYHSGQKISEKSENSFLLRNTLPKALWFYETHWERSELTHCILDWLLGDHSSRPSIYLIVVAICFTSCRYHTHIWMHTQCVHCCMASSCVTVIQVWLKSHWRCTRHRWHSILRFLVKAWMPPIWGSVAKIAIKCCLNCKVLLKLLGAGWLNCRVLDD